MKNKKYKYIIQTYIFRSIQNLKKKEKNTKYRNKKKKTIANILSGLWTYLIQIEKLCTYL